MPGINSRNDDNNNIFPQTLLFGNGLYRCYGENSWNSFLTGLCQRDDLPDDLENDLNSPMTLKSQLISNGNIKSALEKTDRKFFGILDNNELRETIRKILSVGFDDIITTNYDYRLEIAATDKVTITKSFLDSHARNIIKGRSVEPKYLLQSYQSVKYKGVENRVWHIHGEAKKQDSMILSLYYYSKLLARIIGHSGKNKNCFFNAQASNRTPQIRSWIDSFILGDIYILGFGFDYSEIDLWWLLERKNNEKAKHGKIYYYEPVSENNEKVKLLKLFGAEVINFNMSVPENNKNEFYLEFYQKALESIINNIKSKNKEAVK